MSVEEIFEKIHEWYGGDSYWILGHTTKPKGVDGSDLFDQMKPFLSITGYQYSVGDTGDSFEGVIYFEYKKGKYISTGYSM